MSDKDRTEICKILSEMLDNPDKNGIYPTSTCYTKLEHYIESARTQALGFAHGFICARMDSANEDPRVMEVPMMLDSARENL